MITDEMDGQWVAIPLWRSPESIPSDFNLLDTFDPRAVDLPLLVEGFVRCVGDYQGGSRRFSLFYSSEPST